MKWEYKIRRGVRECEVDDVLAEEGEERWEVVDLGEDERYIGRLIRFKRPKQEY